MTRDPDDEALSWGEEADPTHVDAAAESRVVAEGDGTPATGSAMLVTYGIFAGAYLLYVVGWIIAVQQDTLTLPTLLAEVMYQLGEFLAISSPVLWFAAALALTRGGRPIIRVLLFAMGLFVVAPWPFFLAGAS